MTTRNYGFVQSPPQPEDPNFSSHPAFVLSSLVPTSFDLRNQMPVVFDQGPLESCTSNAACAAFEFDMKDQHESVIYLSRLFQYYNQRALDGNADKNVGSSNRAAILAFSLYGVCSDHLWPYIVSQFAVKPTASAYNQAIFHESVSAHVLNQNLYELQFCIGIYKHPFIFGFKVYESFENISNTGIMTMPQPGEKVIDGHAVCAVGYEPGYFIIRNSWGPNWGLHGHFKMPEAFILNPAYCSDFWVLNQIE